jgi:hypothetical protein
LTISISPSPATRVEQVVDAELHHLDVGVTGNHVALRPPLGLGGYPLLFRAGDAPCLKLIVSVAIEILDGCFGGLADL